MGLKITAAANERPVLWLYGDIGAEYGGITADDLRLALSDINDKQDVDLRVNSSGGNYSEGIAMHTLLARRKGKAYGFVDGIAASAATLPLMACKTIEMASGSWLVIHQARGGLGGEGVASDFRAAADRLETVNAQIQTMYKPRWKGTDRELTDALSIDTWMDAETAVKLGLADSISKAMAIAAQIDTDKFHYKNVPAVLLAAKADSFPRLQQAETVLAELFQPKEGQPCESK